MTKITSGRGKLNARDFLLGLVMAVISAPLTIIVESIQNEDFHVDWDHIGKIAMIAGIGYLVKNISTRAKVIIDNPEVVDAVKSGEMEVSITQK